MSQGRSTPPTRRENRPLSGSFSLCKRSEQGEAPSALKTFSSLVPISSRSRGTDHSGWRGVDVLRRVSVRRALVLAISLSTSLRLAATITLLFLVNGCAAPDLSAVASKTPGASMLFSSPRGAPTPIPFFEATTRGEGKEAPEAPDARLALITVSAPPRHIAGAIERPAFGSPNPADHFVISEAEPLSSDEFQNQLAAFISGRVGSARDVLIYVHGFNTSETEARLRTAQIVDDARFGGIPVLFSWPADGGPLSYIEQKDRAMTSRDALESLLLQAARAPGVGKVHLLAHSMGAWLAMEALRELSIAGHPDLDGKLGQVLLASPDIDVSVFREQIARLKDPTAVSIFISAHDRALALSGRLHGDRTRLGAVDLNKPSERAAVQRLGVRVYDLSKYSDGLLDHGAFADLPAAVRSIGARLDAPRGEDAQQAAVIDLGLDKSSRSPQPDPSISVQPLTSNGSSAGTNGSTASSASPSGSTPAASPSGGASPSSSIPSTYAPTPAPKTP